MRNIVKAQLATAASLTVLALAGCREDDAQALSAAEPSPIGYGYAGMTLPTAEPARVSWYEPERGYEWAERAYGLQRAYHDAPPDYTFDYGPYDPWVWESADDGYMYAEPWGDEGYLYYYYEPEAAHPYFVRDSQYGYGFDQTGVLVALFDPYGNYLPIERYQAVAPLAGRYYAHGGELRRASLGTARIKVDRTAWQQRAPLIRTAGDTWIRAAESGERWKAWRAKDDRRQVASFGERASFEERKPQRARAQMHERPPGHARQEDRSRSRDGRDEPRHAARAAEDRGRPASFDDRGGRGRGGDDRSEARGKPEHHDGGRGRGDGADHGGGNGGGKAKSEGHGQGGGHKDGGGGKGGGKKD